MTTHNTTGISTRITTRITTGSPGRRAGSRGRRQRSRRRDERGGGQVSVLVVLFVPILIVVIGLVADGGQRVAAAQDAENAAATAARFGSEAAATQQLAGSDNTGPVAARAARTYLNEAGVPGSVSVSDGQVVVATRVDLPTRFLGVIGIDTVHGTGRASSELRNH